MTTVKMWIVFYLTCIVNVNYVLPYSDYTQRTRYFESNKKLDNFKTQNYRTQWHYTATYRPDYAPYGAQTARLRHSRFPNLNHVMTKLDNLRTTTPTTTTTTNHDDYFRQTVLESDENYDDETYDDVDEDEESAEDYDKWDSQSGEEEETRWQAEEPTERPASSSFTDYKWRHYGTKAGVEESRNRHQNTNSYAADIAAAVQHTLRVNSEGRCKLPSPRVLSVQSEHPDPRKSFIPHCTVLHRCSEDTGCCQNHAMRCAPKTQSIVHLHFYTTTLGKPGNKVEKLAFYNHTECACLVKTSETETTETSHEMLAQNAEPENLKGCKCPEEYTGYYHRLTRCVCDCAESNKDCLRIKKGKEHFSLKDRLCVINGQCGIPNCEYGTYMKDKGRCPKKQEKIETFASVTTISE